MSTSTSTFESILNKTASDIDRPKPLPVGSYTCTVKGLPKQGTSKNKGTPFLEFTLAPIAAGEDVDEDELKAMGGVANKTIRATFYITEGSEYRLWDFLTNCGIDEDLTFGQRIDQAPGCQVVAVIKHTPSQDGQSIYAELARTAAVE